MTKKFTLGLIAEYDCAIEKVRKEASLMCGGVLRNHKIDYMNALCDVRAALKEQAKFS